MRWKKEAGTILANTIPSDCLTDHKQVQFILLIRVQSFIQTYSTHCASAPHACYKGRSLTAMSYGAGIGTPVRWPGYELQYWGFITCLCRNIPVRQRVETDSEQASAPVDGEVAETCISPLTSV